MIAVQRSWVGQGMSLDLKVGEGEVRIKLFPFNIGLWPVCKDELK